MRYRQKANLQSVVFSSAVSFEWLTTSNLSEFKTDVKHATGDVSTFTAKVIEHRWSSMIQSHFNIVRLVARSSLLQIMISVTNSNWPPILVYAFIFKLYFERSTEDCPNCAHRTSTTSRGCTTMTHLINLKAIGLLQFKFKFISWLFPMSVSNYGRWLIAGRVTGWLILVIWTIACKVKLWASYTLVKTNWSPFICLRN